MPKPTPADVEELARSLKRSQQMFACKDTAAKLKRCQRCKRPQRLAHFYRNKRMKDGRAIYCKDCMREYWPLGSRRYYKARWKYGVSTDQIDEMLATQGNACAICRGIFDMSKKMPFAIDHCHTSGRIRGLLCSSCNQGLGRFGDRIDLLRSAIEYLRTAEAQRA